MGVRCSCQTGVTRPVSMAARWVFGAVARLESGHCQSNWYQINVINDINCAGVQFSGSVSTVGVQYSSVTTVGVQCSSVRPLSLPWVSSVAVSDHCHCHGVQCSSVRPLSLSWVFSAAASDHCHYRGCSAQQCQTTVTTVGVQCSSVRLR